jgi:1-acyl-sn-glycerol-3-phosphate acyltransferase
MREEPIQPPKPVTEIWRPDLIALLKLTSARKVFRLIYRLMMKLLAFLFLRVTVSGLENFPAHGPAMVVYNHSGDVDAVLLVAAIPHVMEGIVKIENRDDHWLVSPLFRAYGFIWIHRGKPDRKALRVILDGFAEGRIIALSPEGRQSLTGGLEEGTDGATFLALKSGVPIVPVAMTGTQNTKTYANMKRWRRSPVTLTVGKPFHLEEQPTHQETIRAGTRRIMEEIARLLPEEYRGVYAGTADSTA